MTTSGRIVVPVLVACVAWFGACGEARAQGKKSDAVVKVRAEAGRPGTDGVTPVHLTLAVDHGWHIYANPAGQEDLADSATAVTAAGGAKVEAVEYPAGKLVKDKAIGDYKVYEDRVTITAKVRRPAGGGPIDLNVKFQACSDTRCLVPATVKVSVP